MNTPDLMPILSTGAHDSPAEGACIMEMASFLSGEAWTDSPACTHPVIARMAQVVNDRLPDERRGDLLPLLPRIMGTAATGTAHERHVLSVRLAVWCARQVLPLVRAADRDVCKKAIVAAEDWREGTASAEQCRTAATAANAAAAAAAYAATYAAAAAANAAAAAYAAAAANAAAAAAYAAAAANAATYAAAAAANAATNDDLTNDDLTALLTGLLDEHDRLTGRDPVPALPAEDIKRLAALTT